MKVSAVIGANYGDEGKGHTVHHLADSNTLVVRFNGGAQAGHTVVSRQGRRHVFHHIGSGTFDGADTFLSQYFIVNPILFVPEHFALVAHHCQSPDVYIDPRAVVTTPYDMMINQAMEQARGRGRHGSCGTGINETVVRSMHRKFRLTADMLGNEPALRAYLDEIRRVWVPSRAKDVGLDLSRLPYLSDDRICEAFVRDSQATVVHARLATAEELFGPDTDIDRYEHILFEGAQGLRLDERSHDFPHVTRSRTGLENVLRIIDDVWLDDNTIDVYYVTRPYLTRHGEGPLLGELEGPPFERIRDETNVPNMFQGSIRFAHLDIIGMTETIQRDLLGYRDRYDIRPRLSITCVDQVPEYFPVNIGDRKVRTNIESLDQMILGEGNKPLILNGER